MPAPRRYDDEPLLALVAEFLAWPESSGETTLDGAIRKAMGFVAGSEEWSEHKTSQTFDRLRKEHRRSGTRRVEAIQSRSFPHYPLMPTLLGLPSEPERELHLSESWRLESGLRRGAEFLVFMADAMARQRGKASFDRDLMKVAGQVVALLNALASERGMPAIEEWEERRVNPNDEPPAV